MKNKRMIYWGGNHQTTIPQMGACGGGGDPSGGGGAGGGANAAGSGQEKPKDPKNLGKFPSLDGMLDALKVAGAALAVGAVVAGVVNGASVFFKKNRDPKKKDDKDLIPNLPDLPNIPSLNTPPSPALGMEDTGFDIVTPLAMDSSTLGSNLQAFNQDGEASGFTENGLPKAEFVGQQAEYPNGDLYVWKEPPGMWVNFGQQTPRYTTEFQSRQRKTTTDFISKITSVDGRDNIKIENSWLELGEQVGNIGEIPGPDQLYNDWYIVYGRKKKDLYTYLRFNDDQRSLIVNHKVDDVKYTEYPHSLVYKLYEPLPPEIEQGDLVYVVKEMTPPIEERVQLYDFVDESISDVVLRNPKWDDPSVADSWFNETNTKYKSEQDILTDNLDIKRIIEDNIISGSLDKNSVKLTGTDFRQFKNFVKFSSVEDRLKNFKYKLQRIELFESQSTNLSGISGSLTYSYTGSLSDKVRKIKNEFTPFEHYMYFESSSYVSSSLGVFHDNAWPVKSGTGTLLNPYVPYAVTESKAVTWYDNQILSASKYDRENGDRFLVNIPAHIRDDGANTPFLTFINMTGEHFDKIWNYINQIPQIYDRRTSLDEGLSKDLIYQVGRSFGFHLNDGNDMVDLPRFVAGVEVTGSDSSYSTYSTTPEKDITREIWKRILSNMPFFLKTKGTVRSLKGLISCYGIPSSILRVREYGGPDVLSDSELNPENRGLESYMVSRKFTRALDFEGAQSVSTTWVNDTNSSRKPDTIEFRFKTSTGSNQTLFQVDDEFAIRLKDNGSTDNRGQVSFVLSGGVSDADLEIVSSELPVYDGEYYSVMLTRTSASSHIHNLRKSSPGQLGSDSTAQNITYALTVGKYDSGLKRIIYKSYSSASVDGTVSSSWNSSYAGNGSNVRIGGLNSTFGSQFKGSMMEFRYWNTALNSASFDNHVASPKSFDGNHASASWTDLVLRYSFDDNKDLSSDTSIRDTSADQSYTAAGTAVGYGAVSTPHFSFTIDEQRARVPNVGPSRRIDNKVRTEENKLTFGGLSPHKRSELSAYDLSPLDSNKVGVYFSPTDVVNEDIIFSVANLDFDQYIGDPRDKYKLRYRQLDSVATTYWQKYNGPNNFWDYLRLLKFYDKSIFDQLRRLTPARANTRFGVLIEPNIFERSKQVIGAPPNISDRVFRGTISDFPYSGSSNYITYTGSIDDIILSGTGSYDTYTGSLDVMTIFSQSANFPTYTSSISINSQISESAKYLTYTGSASNEIFLEHSIYNLSEKYGTEGTNFTLKRGGPEKLFSEALQPNITGSIISEHNYERRFFYTTEASASKNNYFSSSFVRSDLQSIFRNTQMDRVAYVGSVQTKKTTIDGLDPVVVKLTNPTTLITKEGGESKLDTV